MAVAAMLCLSACEYKPPSVSVTADAAYSGDIINSFVDTSTGYVIGGSVARQWLRSDECLVNLNRRQSWWVYGLGRALGRVDSGAAQSAAPACDGWSVEFGKLGPKTNQAFAILGRWNGAPRKSSPQSLDHPAYLSVVADVLEANGIDRSEARLTANMRIDLDDDGIDEVLLSASNLWPGEDSAPAGGYSLVLLRTSSASGVKTKTLTSSILHEACRACAPVVHSIAGLVDLNGDGNVEVIIRTASVAARGGIVYAAGNNETQEVFAWSCAATSPSQ